MGGKRALRLFEAIGVELEYMVVDREHLNVLPIVDRLIEAESGVIQTDVEKDDITWSNELALHVVELKTTTPARELEPLAPLFQREVNRVNSLLETMSGRLMPSAMHPWMNPDDEMRLWPHEYNAVYEAFNRIFDCRGHGWANLQSMHLNLPFADDDEFGRLHAAIRVLLPIIPALSAASPFADGARAAHLDHRLAVYAQNARRVPSVSGSVIPEPVYTQEQYEATILGRIYRDLEPHDPEGTLRYEWANARGAIARFDRGSIEIRIIDVQETVRSDLAIAAAVFDAIRAMANEAWCSLEDQKAWAVAPLKAVFDSVVRDAQSAMITDVDYLSLFDLGEEPCSARDLWRSILERCHRREPTSLDPFMRDLEFILERGSLAARVVAAAGSSPTRDQLGAVYGRLCDCLAGGQLFDGSTG